MAKFGLFVFASFLLLSGLFIAFGVFPELQRDVFGYCVLVTGFCAFALGVYSMTVGMDDLDDWQARLYAGRLSAAERAELHLADRCRRVLELDCDYAPLTWE